MEFIRKNTRVLFILVLPVYFLIIQGSILNKHTHFFSNGLVATHSHPLDKKSDDPVKSHDHSQSEICLFSVLNIDLHTATAEYFIDFKTPDNPGTFLVADIQIEYTSPNYQLVPRGPPSRI